MSIETVLLPLFVQVALSLALLFWMGYLRVTAVRSGAVHPRDIALREPNWPPHVLKVANAAHNQFETPLLFYLLTVLVIVTSVADVTFVVLAWIFVALRIVHALVHVTSNRVPRRGLIFIASFLVLTVMWLSFMARILLSP